MGESAVLVPNIWRLKEQRLATIAMTELGQPPGVLRSALACWIIGLLALALFAYAAARAATVSFTYDETYTYMEHVRKGIFFQQAHDKMGGNHHLLNVWGMMASRALFGESEFALRVPNLLAYALYLFATGMLALRARHVILAVATFLLLNLHPYLIDFFSLARGYGLAAGFMMMSLWQMWSYLREGERLQQVRYATVFAALSAMSHVIMVNYLLAFLGAITLFVMSRAHRTGSWAPRSHMLWVVGVALLGLGSMVPNALGLFQGGSLNYGCNEWWVCSMRCLAEKILYHVPYEKEPLVMMAYALWCCFGVCAAAVLLVWRTRQMHLLGPFGFGLLALVLCVLSFTVQHVLFGVPFPGSRTSMFLLPLLAFILVAALLAWPVYRWLATAVAVVGCVPLSILMHDAWNMRYAVEWKSSGEMRTVLEIIEGDHMPLGLLRPGVNIITGFGTRGVVDYYTSSRGWNWLAAEIRTDTGFAAADYYVVEFDAHHLVDEEHWTKLYHSSETGLALFRDERMRRDLTTVVHHVSYADSASGQFPLLDWVVPENFPPGPQIAVGSILSREQNNSNWVGLFLEHWRNGQLLAKRSQPSHLQILHYGEWERSRIMLQLPDTLLPGDRLRFSVWPCYSFPAIELGAADLWIAQ